MFQLRLLLISGESFELTILNLNNLFYDILSYIQTYYDKNIDEYNLNIIFNDYRDQSLNCIDHIDFVNIIKLINILQIKKSYNVNIIFTYIPRMKYYYKNKEYNIILNENTNIKYIMKELCTKHIFIECRCKITLLNFNTNKIYYICFVNCYKSMFYNINNDDYEDELICELYNYLDIENDNLDTIKSTLFELKIEDLII